MTYYKETVISFMNKQVTLGVEYLRDSMFWQRFYLFIYLLKENRMC